MLWHTGDIYEPCHPLFPCGNSSSGMCLLKLCKSEIKQQQQNPPTPNKPNKLNWKTRSQTFSLITEHHLLRASWVLHGTLTSPSVQLVVAVEPRPMWFGGTRFHGSAYYWFSYCKLSLVPAEGFQAIWPHEAQQITGITLLFSMCHCHAWIITQLATWGWGHLFRAGGVERSLRQEGKVPESSMRVSEMLWGTMSIPALLQGTSGKQHQ